MSIPKSMMFRQARAASGSIRAQAGRTSSRGPIRFASSSSSSSSTSNRSALGVAPIALATTLALGSIYAFSQKQPLALESKERKSYWERMRIEEKQRQGEKAEKEEAEAKSSSSSEKDSSESSNEEVASDATSDLAEEASQESAFNPETNEINWDCPCLGGMAHGPCGEEFKTAFSCFVFSEEEPKGIDCVEKFKGMQDCFRKHPDHYKEELEDDEEFERQETNEAGKSEGETKDEYDDDEGVREFRREMNKEQ